MGDKPLPTVSVVIGVRNGETTISSTIESLLAQKGVDLEVIVVNDGSTDNTENILQAVAQKDSRVRIFGRDSGGLTRALIYGCEKATGEFIARQDDKDISLPGRLVKQALILQENPKASMCSPYVLFKVPEGVTSEIRKPSAQDVSDGLMGPAAHGSVMMRRSTYQRVGGYRSEFYYAQDIDLWSRLVEHGEHIILPEVLYESMIAPDSISGSYRHEQNKFYNLIVELTQARRAGYTEHPYLSMARELATACHQLKSTSSREADGAYFLGSCLCTKHPSIAKKYFLQALKHNPYHLRALLKLAILR